MAENTLPKYGFYQVRNENEITSGYDPGSVVYNKTRLEITIFDASGTATVYGGGIKKAELNKGELTLTDNTGNSLSLNINSYLAQYVPKQGNSTITGIVTASVFKSDTFKPASASSSNPTGAVGSSDSPFASGYIKKLEGEEFTGTAYKAVNDENGKNIANTYATKEEVEDVIAGEIGDIIFPEYTIEKLTEPENNTYAATYQLKKGNDFVGAKINVLKDSVVSSGAVVENPEGQNPGLYIELTLANAENDKLYIPVNQLVDDYSGSTYITVNSNGSIELNVQELKNKFLPISGGTIEGNIELNQLMVKKIVADGSASGMGAKDIGTAQNKFNNVYAHNFQGNATSATTATDYSSSGGIANKFSDLEEMFKWKQLD